jgi:hypothetical protein
MFIIFPLTIVGILTFFIHKLLWDGPVQRGDKMLDDYKIYCANESNKEELDKIKKLNLK